MRLARWMLAALALVCAAPVPAETLRIGTEPDYAPYAMQRDDGSLIGFDIDLGKLICARGPFECEWVVMAFSDLVGAVHDARLDIAIAGMADTPGRRELVDFSRTYRPATPGFGAYAALTPGLSADGLLAGVQEGTIQQEFLTAIGRAHRSYSDTTTMIAALRAGEVEVVFGGLGNIEQAAETTDPDLRIVEIVAVDNYGTAIAISRERKGLTARIDLILNGIEAEGLLQDLEDRWFPEGESL